MVMFLQSSMGELVNVSGSSVLEKSIGATNGWRKERRVESKFTTEFSYLHFTFKHL